MINRVNLVWIFKKAYFFVYRLDMGESSLIFLFHFLTDQILKGLIKK